MEDRDKVLKRAEAAEGALAIVRIQRDQYEEAWAKEKAKVAKLAKVDESKQELLTHQADQIRGMARGLENSKAKVAKLEAKCILLDSEMANRCYECEAHKNEE